MPSSTFSRLSLSMPAAVAAVHTLHQQPVAAHRVYPSLTGSNACQPVDAIPVSASFCGSPTTSSLAAALDLDLDRCPETVPSSSSPTGLAVLSR
ncbi:hypothetical protein AURDEDRAFT_163300 [Auricularia subglabra TFB-10046 SS5]|nr:hypothetical protein AURDEDRAFT_163300 [Auricularia subglabra TFB-10046 SS5]